VTAQAPRSSNDTTKLGWALRAANAGLRVHPLRPNTKIAMIPGWPELATTDVERIKKWWATYPDANIGIATGGTLLVIDCDVKDDVDGIANWRRLQAEHGGTIRCTPTVRTPSGGLHFYFSKPADRIVRNSAGKLAPGVDVRGEGGYVVGAGSVLDGVAYEWVVS